MSYYGKEGDNEFSIPVIIPETRVYHYDHADLDASFKFHIPVEPDTMIVSVVYEVTEAFAGGTPSLNIGDGTDADAFCAAVDSTVLGGVTNSLAGAAANAGGKKYSALGEICLTHATGLTAGKANVYVTALSLKGNWRKADL